MYSVGSTKEYNLRRELSISGLLLKHDNGTEHTLPSTIPYISSWVFPSWDIGQSYILLHVSRSSASSFASDNVVFLACIVHFCEPIACLAKRSVAIWATLMRVQDHIPKKTAQKLSTNMHADCGETNDRTH